MQDEDDEYLYGSAPVSLLESQATESATMTESGKSEEPSGEPSGLGGISEDEGDDDKYDDDEQATDDEDDLEIIIEAPVRSIDFRAQNAKQGTKAPPKAAPQTPQPSLTTEYTPIQRGGSNASLGSHVPGVSHVPPSTGTAEVHRPPDDGLDTSTLPPVPAPPSHPSIDPNEVGTIDGRSVLEVDLSSMADKAWRRPGTDIRDYFNYGFDEISYEAYCYRRRDLGELANVLKTNVLNFSGMSEDQVVSLPPEVRQMVMTGTNAMMNGAANQGLMNPGMMMDMSGMMPMGMAMPGDMGMMSMDGGNGMMVPDASARQGVGNPDQGMTGIPGEGYTGNASNGVIGMGMAGEMPDPGQTNQQMYAAPDNSGHGAMRGVASGPSYRGAGRGQPSGRGFTSRGRGRGGYPTGPTVPLRSTSPLPPNVPTGPRNQNKYKDRDGNAQAVDGLDYGGNKDGGRRTPSEQPEDRGRKRRSSPGLDESRSSKRR